MAPSTRTALIPGGARGIGREIGLSLARAGWRVVVAYRKSEADAEATVAAIQSAGSTGASFRADVSDPAQAARLVADTEARFGSVDALVQCAGPYHRVDLLDETPEGWNEMFAHNLHPLFYLSKAAAPGMIRRKWGRIVAFSMATADRISAQPNVTAHFIAKSGVLILIRTLARVLAPHNITANAISPGFINSGSAPAEELEKMKKMIPAGYIGATKDAASAAQFLLSDDAAYVNGTNVMLSGGWGI